MEFPPILQNCYKIGTQPRGFSLLKKKYENTQNTKISIKSRTRVPHSDDNYLIDYETYFGDFWGGAVSPDFIAERCREHKHPIKSLDTLIL